MKAADYSYLSVWAMDVITRAAYLTIEVSPKSTDAACRLQDLYSIHPSRSCPCVSREHNYPTQILYNTHSDSNGELIVHYIMFRSRLRQRTEEIVTEEEVEDLKQEISKLQKQLHQIVDQEIASNNEACGLATNGFVHLNIELEGLTEERG